MTVTLEGNEPTSSPVPMTAFDGECAIGALLLAVERMPLDELKKLSTNIRHSLKDHPPQPRAFLRAYLELVIDSISDREG